MGLVYNHLSQDERDDIIAKALISREQEHWHYELNRINYESILKSIAESELPLEWPESLKGCRGQSSETLATTLTYEDFVLVSRLQFRERVQVLLATTIAEQSKVEAVHKALSTHMLPERLSAAIIRVQQAPKLVQNK